MDSLYLNEMAEKNCFTVGSRKDYGSQLFRFIKGKVSKTEDAEDILQEVWYQTSRLANIDDLENVGAWLYSVTRNKITDNYRKKKSDSLEDYTYEDEDGSFSIKEILLADDSNNPELKMFKDIFWDELMKALDELPDNQRRVFFRMKLRKNFAGNCRRRRRESKDCYQQKRICCKTPS